MADFTLESKILISIVMHYKKIKIYFAEKPCLRIALSELVNILCIITTSGDTKQVCALQA